MFGIGLPEVGTLVILLLMGALYFVPSFIAKGRKHHQAFAIFMLNLFAGWTILGWVGALVWACTKPNVSVPVSVSIDQ
jgi:hypothetical protein